MDRKCLTLRELQIVELGILDYIDRLCSTNGIVYYIAFGTALGAARHGGFIPWDDDIDVLMRRDQYEKLERLMAEKQNERYVLKSLRTDKKYSLPYAKVIDTHTFLVRHQYRKCIELGAYVDVFILDYLPSGKKILKVWNILLNQLYTLWKISQAADCGGRNRLTKSMQHLIRIVPPRQYAIIMNGAAGWFNGRRHSSKVNMVHFYPRPGMASDFCKTYGKGKRILYENHLYNGPKDMNTFLSGIYGDYMTYPPINEQVPKHPNYVYM